MNASHAIVCGLLITLISFAIEANPLTPAQQKSLRSLLGDELSEFLAAGEQEQNMESMQSRLLRDLRMKQRTKGVWSRVLNDQTVTRKHKAGSKKGTSSSRNGCFGHKMDRIGTLSGMGC
uniref:Natriuretic peptide C n=1 Tax=Paramormyrops kingsleyae TaxID=1676925 RepID=A0A3B3RU30_9TELE